MATLTIDTHKFIERLSAAGIAKHEAEAIADGIKEYIARVESAQCRIALFKWLGAILLGQAWLITLLVKLI